MLETVVNMNQVHISEHTVPAAKQPLTQLVTLTANQLHTHIHTGNRNSESKPTSTICKPNSESELLNHTSNW